MLHNFLVPVTIDGAPRSIVVRDLPTGLFFLDAGPSLLAAETWADTVLCRAAVTPALTLESLARLGRDRDEPILAYFRAVGYYDARDVADIAERGARVGRALGDAFALPAPVAAAATPAAVPFAASMAPHGNIREILARIADASSTPPHVIWRQWAISDFCFSWRVLLGDELLSPRRM